MVGNGLYVFMISCVVKCQLHGVPNLPLHANESPESANFFSQPLKLPRLKQILEGHFVSTKIPFFMTLDLLLSINF